MPIFDPDKRDQLDAIPLKQNDQLGDDDAGYLYAEEFNLLVSLLRDIGDAAVHVYLPSESNPGADDIGEGEVVVYAKDGELIAARNLGGTVQYSVVTSGWSTTAP